MTKIVLDYEAAPDFLAATIENLRAHMPGPPAIGVAAPSAAGKGHLIGKLLERLDASGIGILALDRYYRGRTAMLSEGVSSFDDPRALDLDRAAADIAALKAGEAAAVPIYDFPSGERTGYEPFGPVDVLIVEGLFALREPILSRLDYRVFIETDPHSALFRRLFRDAGLSGRTKQSSRVVIDQYFREVLPAQREHIDPTKAAADVVVASRYDAKKEADRAGLREHQLKVPGRPHEEQLRAVGAERLGTMVHEDTYLVPLDRPLDDEIVRIRVENGVTTLFTYKGPLIEPLSDELRIKAKRDVEITAEDARRFRDVYREIAVIRKVRDLYAMPPMPIQIACDRVEGLGEFVEFRTSYPAGREVARWFGQTIKELGLRPLTAKTGSNPAIFESYLDLWLKKNGAKVS